MSSADPFTLSGQHIRVLQELRPVLSDNVYDVISVCLPDTTILYNNRSIMTVLGYTTEEMIGRTALEYIHPADHDRVTAAVSEALHNETRRAQVELRIRHRNGSWRDCESIGRFVDGSDGNPYLIVVTRDVTTRVQTAYTNRLLLSALNAAGNSAVITETDGTIIWVNAAFTLTTGYSYEEAVGKKPSILKSGRHDPAFYKNLWDTVLRGRIWHGELINRRKDGSLYAEEMSITPICGEDGKPHHFVAIKQDITARKESEKQLRLMSSIARQTSEGVAATDMDGQIVVANAAFAHMHKCEETDLPGRPIHHFFAHHQVARLNLLLDQVRTDENAYGDFIQKRADAGPFPSSVHVSLLHDEVGSPSGFIFLCRDITAQRAREALERKSQNLQAAVASMEQVIGVLGHELRTPLAAIRVTSEVIQSDLMSRAADTDGHLALITAMQKQAVHMSDIIHNMLEAARLNSGHAQWTWDTINLHDTIHSTISTIRAAHAVEGIELSATVEPEHLTMRGDHNAIQRLVTNLTTNALHHTREGFVTVHVTEARIDEQRWIVIDVTDSGEGIPQDIIDQLGKPFALNAGMVGADHIRGAGLGFAICRGIVNAHGGVIDIQSRMGEGSHITVRLRADLNHPQAIDQQAAALTLGVHS